MAGPPRAAHAKSHSDAFDVPCIAVWCNEIVRGCLHLSDCQGLPTSFCGHQCVASLKMFSFDFFAKSVVKLALNVQQILQDVVDCSACMILVACIFIHQYMHILTYALASGFKNIGSLNQGCVCVCVSTMHAQSSTFSHARMCVCACIHENMHTYIHIYIYTYRNKYTYKQKQEKQKKRGED